MANNSNLRTWTASNSARKRLPKKPPEGQHLSAIATDCEFYRTLLPHRHTRKTIFTLKAATSVGWDVKPESPGLEKTLWMPLTALCREP
jgi:hypothetical protein